MLYEYYYQKRPYKIRYYNQKLKNIENEYWNEDDLQIIKRIDKIHKYECQSKLIQKNNKTYEFLRDTSELMLKNNVILHDIIIVKDLELDLFSKLSIS